MNIPFNIDDYETWPVSIRDFARMVLSDFRSPEDVSVYYFEELTRLIQKEVSQFILYHYTKEHKLFPYSKIGLRVLNAHKHIDWFLKNFLQYFSPDEQIRIREVLSTQLSTRRRQPEGCLCFVNSPQRGYELSRMEEFLKWFGGEEIFWNFKVKTSHSAIDSSILQTLSTIGRSCIVKFIGEAAHIRQENFVRSIIYKTFNAGCYSCNGRIYCNIPANRIQEIIYV